MTLELFFLGCFAFGFVLCLIAFLAGSAHLHLHIPVSYTHLTLPTILRV